MWGEAEHKRCCGHPEHSLHRLPDTRVGRRKGTVAITGANGFIGRYLTARLSSNGWQVRGITREGDPVLGYHAIGTLEHAPDWNACLAGTDAVIHCAAVAHQPVDEQSLDSLYRINRDAVEALAEASFHNGARRFIFLSSAKVYGEASAPGSAFREDDLPRPEDHYGKSKLQAEEALHPLFDDGKEVCCLRLPLVYGPRVKANFNKLQRLAGSRLPLPLAGIHNARSLLSLENLALTLIALLDSRVWPAFTLNVADPAPVSTPELVRALARAQGSSVRLFAFPPRLLKGIGRCLGRGSFVSRLTDNLELDTTRLQSWCPQLKRLSTQEAIGFHFGIDAQYPKGAAA